mgnify:CR=1 FL=1
MEMPYKTLKSKNLSSLVNVIKVITVLSYIGLAISLLFIILANIGVAVFHGALLLPYSLLGLLLSGLVAILVSFEETYRLKVLNGSRVRESDIKNQ